MSLKNCIVNIVSALFIKKKWRKSVRRFLSTNKKFENIKFIFSRYAKTQKYNLIILDDFFPLPFANTWRSTEFHEYFKKIKDVHCFNFNENIRLEEYNQRVQSYLKYEPQNKEFISKLNIKRKVRANLAYILFYHNALKMLPWLEKNKIPFVFCFYPGGAFYPYNAECDEGLKKIFNSELFRGVVVTQQFAYDYLLKNDLCEKEDILYKYGCFFQQNESNINFIPKKYYNKDKATFDICFVAYKYTDKGLKKGFDIFIKIAELLTAKYDDINFHIVGNWENIAASYKNNPKIHFYGAKPSEFFAEFYSKMDILISPNRSFKLMNKLGPEEGYNYEFDGFPLGLDAGLYEVALFVTDELNNRDKLYKDGEDIVIINHNVEDIIQKIEHYYYNPDALYQLSKKQKNKIEELFNTENQITPRLGLLNKYLDKSKSKNVCKKKKPFKILIVAIIHSIHTYRWVKQLEESGHEVYLHCISPYVVGYGQKDYSWCNDLFDIKLNSRDKKRYKLTYVFKKIVSRKTYKDVTFREYALMQEIKRIQPDLVHTMSFQEAAYPMLRIYKKLVKRNKMPKWLATNWGSDIYWWRHEEDHNTQIKNILDRCDYYSCENQRDLDIVKSMGFKGGCFEPFPNAGGIDLNLVQKLNQQKPSERKVIFLKGYNNHWGRATVAVRAIERCAKEIKEKGLEIVVHNSQIPVPQYLEEIKQKYGINYQIMPFVGHEQMLEMYGKSRIAIGLSLSDGNSTSLLEAIALGSFPIQSNTAATDEWFEDGVGGYSVPPEEVDILADRLRKAIIDDELVDNAYDVNWKTTQELLDYNVVKQKTLNLYKTIEDDIKSERGVKNV